jgi:hypothetical protein
VSGIGNERHRVRQHAEHNLCDHKRDVERRRDGKSPAEIRRRVVVAMAMMISVVMVVVVNRMGM